METRVYTVWRVTPHSWGPKAWEVLLSRSTALCTIVDSDAADAKREVMDHQAHCGFNTWLT